MTELEYIEREARIQGEADYQDELAQANAEIVRLRNILDIIHNVTHANVPPSERFAWIREYCEDSK